MKRILRYLLFLSVLAVMVSCEKDDNDVNVNKAIYQKMQDWYFWYDQLPSVELNDYSNPSGLMDALRVNPPDREWSYVTTREEFEAYYNGGAYVGFGFGSGWDAQGNLYILFVYKNSPLYQVGIRRGWQILTIDGQTPTTSNYSSLIGANDAGITKTFKVKSPEGVEYTYTFSKGEIDMNTVLLDTVYTYGTSRIGYLVLESFINNTADELDNVFTKFKNQRVTDLIVDLRYNGGGTVLVAWQLANYLGGNVAYGKIFGTFYYNDKHQNENSSMLFSSEHLSLTLNRVVFITTSSTASASELVINGLKPFIGVTLVGSTTHGKPVGMNAFYIDDWVLLPVTFTIRNANNEGDYFDGIPVDIQASDDITTMFGDPTEASLNAALAYLGVSVKSPNVKGYSPVLVPERKGLYAEIGAW
ncbi:MAG: carboxyl-terminal protease [Bacteroidales bacterium]|nr:carboxyl-terminal protease [Bacteroidales bacterium]